MRSIQRNILDARRWLCLFLVCAFVLCGIGGIHQRAQAIVGVDDALIGILIAGLAAVGITFVSTGAYASLTEYVGSLLDEYADSRGLTPAGLFTGVQTGANSLGQILVNNPMVRLISAFATWLKIKFSLVDNSSANVQSSSGINGVPGVYLPWVVGRYYSGSTYTYDVYELNATAPVFMCRWTGNSVSGNIVHFLLYSDEPFVAQRHRNDEYRDYTGELYNQGYFVEVFSTQPNQYNGWLSRNGREIYTIEDSGFSTLASIKDALDGQPVEPLPSVDINTGVMAPPLESPDYNNGDGAVIDVSAPWGMTYPDIVNKWLPKEWAPGMSGNPSMTYDAAPAIDEQVQTGPETSQVSSDPGDYAVPGLQTVFPFCIPFDIYNLLSALAADPVAPSFTWRFYVPGICDENITVDLSPFDNVAQIVRTVELLAFIVGLALVTRERFLRG